MTIRLGICNELFQDWPLPEICQTIKALGYDGLEIAPFTLAPRITDVSNHQRREIARIITDHGLECIGLHWLLAKTEGFYLTSPDRAIRRQTAQYFEDLAEATRDLGGALMVLGSPQQRNLLPGVTLHQAEDFAIEVLTAILPTLDACQVDLCLEPLAPVETDFLTTCQQTVDLIQRINHPRIKLHMDVKAQSAEPVGTVPELITRYIGHAGHFHANDVNLRGPGMGEVNFQPILEAIAASGYDRYVSVEVFDFSPGARATAELSIATLKRFLPA